MPVLRGLFVVGALAVLLTPRAGAQAPPTTAPPPTVVAAPTTAVPTTAPPPTTVPEAHGDATLTVTPSQGLVDGQTVEVSGTGYPPNRSEWAVWICPPGSSAIADSIDLVASCGSEEVHGASDGSGTLRGSFVAHRVVEQMNRGFTQFDCGTDGCEVFVVGDNHLYYEAAVLITFATAVIPATPPFTG